MTEQPGASIVEFPVGRPMRKLPDPEMNRLLDSAAELLRHSGYENLSMITVSRRAGIKLATVHLCIRTTPHLIAELCYRQLIRCWETESSGRDARERLEAVFEELAALMTTNPALTTAARLSALSGDRDALRVWLHTGAALRHRLAQALGTDTPDAVIDLVAMAVTGEIIKCGNGSGSYVNMAARLAACSKLLTPM